MNINEVKEISVLWIILEGAVKAQNIHICVNVMEQITKLEASKTREINESKS